MKKDRSEHIENKESSFDNTEEEQVIEAGPITSLDESSVRINPFVKLKFLTTRTLAYIIIIILTLSVLGHYMVTIYLLKFRTYFYQVKQILNNFQNHLSSHVTDI